MCLYFRLDDHKELIKNLFKGRQSIAVYKVVVQKDGKLITPYQGHEVKTVKGFFHSNRKNAKLTREEKTSTSSFNLNTVDQGIHVYMEHPYPGMTKKEILPHIVVNATAYKNDVVAVNTYEAVFTKIKFDPKAIKKYKTEQKPKPKPKLYKIQKSTTIYVIADNQKQARLILENVDSGGEDYNKFIKTAREGKITRITNLQQIAKRDYHYVPFCAASFDYYGDVKEFISTENL